ncbi:MAG: polysaccharide pyruvyl transferase family protein [Acidobacteriota bacterium]
MTTLFCLRPATRNIGNDIINRATTDLLVAVFGAETSIVNIPALAGPQEGGLTARQIYDINRLADGVVIGGGNLFENGQLTVDEHALGALRRPMLLLGLAHGRIYGRDGSLVHRTDAMPPHVIRRLVECSVLTLVRDHGTQEILRELAIPSVEVGGCPTLFMPPNPAGWTAGDRVMISVRHPDRMSISPPLQRRVADDVRGLIAALQAAFGGPIVLACHDYADLEFAAAFTDAASIYFDDVERYIDALRRCRLSVSYRLHAFLPCLAFGTPSIHLSYDERGRAAVATAGMGEWDIDMTRDTCVVDAVMTRARQIERYQGLRCQSAETIAGLREITIAGLRRFATAVAQPRP